MPRASLEALLMAVNDGDIDSVATCFFARGNQWNPNAIDENGLTFERNAGAPLLFIACRNNRINVAKFLISQGADVNLGRTNDGCTPLVIAAQEGHFELLQLLLKSKANINQTTEDDNTSALYMAAQNGFVDIVATLMAAQATPDRCHRSTPLYVACQNGFTDIVRMLLEHDSDVSLGTLDDHTAPLYIAAQNGYVQIVQALIDAKAELNSARLSNLTTPLHSAAFQGQLEVVHVLLIHGVDFTAQTRDGKKAVDIARQANQQRALKLLEDHTAETNCVYAVRLRHMALIHTDMGSTMKFPKDVLTIVSRFIGVFWLPAGNLAVLTVGVEDRVESV